MASTPRAAALLVLALPACATGRAVWVESVPAGASIVVDGLQQGAQTPARVDAGPSLRRLTLRLGEATISATLGAVGPGSREPVLLSTSDGSLWIERDVEPRRTLRGYFPTAEAWFLVANTRALLVDSASCDDAGIWRVPPGPHRLHGAFGEATLNGDPGFVVRLTIEVTNQPSALTVRLDEEGLTGELRGAGATSGLALVAERDVTLRGTDLDVVAETADGRRATLRFRIDPRVRTAVHVAIAASTRAPRRLSRSRSHGIQPPIAAALCPISRRQSLDESPGFACVLPPRPEPNCSHSAQSSPVTLTPRRGGRSGSRPDVGRRRVPPAVAGSPSPSEIAGLVVSSVVSSVVSPGRCRVPVT